MQLEWVSKKNHKTSPPKKTMQPLHTQNHSTSPKKIMQPLQQKEKIMQPLHKTVVTIVTVVKEVTKKNSQKEKLFSPGNFFFIKKPLHTKNHATS